MAKMVNDLAMDELLNYIADNGSRIVAMSSYTTVYAIANDATTGNMLARSTSAIASTSYTLAAGDVSGRKVTTPAQSNITVAGSGTANHVAILSTGLTSVILVTECTTQALTTGNTVTIPAFKNEVADPS